MLSGNILFEIRNITIRDAYPMIMENKISLRLSILEFWIMFIMKKLTFIMRANIISSGITFDWVKVDSYSDGDPVRVEDKLKFVKSYFLRSITWLLTAKAAPQHIISNPIFSLNALTAICYLFCLSAPLPMSGF